MSITAPHDSLFKFAFGDPVHAAALLRSLLSPEAAALVAWESFAAERGSFVGSELQSRHSDLLFSLRIRGRPALAYFLFEHQSRPDLLMPYRILLYIVRIWEWWLAHHPKASKLPAILPVVLHHGEQGWTAARELVEVIDLSPDELGSLAHFLPQLRIMVDDLATQTEAELHERVLTDLGRLTLLMLRDLPYAKAPGATLVKHLGLILRVVRAPSGLRALEALMSYTLATTDLATEDLVHILGPHLGEKETTAMITTAQKLFNEGLEKGTARTLLAQIRLRYGEPSIEVVRRVESASMEERDGWIGRIFVAQTVEELLGTDGSGRP